MLYPQIYLPYSVGFVSLVFSRCKLSCQWCKWEQRQHTRISTPLARSHPTVSRCYIVIAAWWIPSAAPTGHDRRLTPSTDPDTAEHPTRSLHRWPYHPWGIDAGARVAAIRAFSELGYMSDHIQTEWQMRFLDIRASHSHDTVEVFLWYQMFYLECQILWQCLQRNRQKAIAAGAFLWLW